MPPEALTVTVELPPLQRIGVKLEVAITLFTVTVPLAGTEEHPPLVFVTTTV